jgi:ABC-type antimicrobial peptide transport system permease subunit
MILKNLLRRKGRTAMCITAIAISTALLVSLLSVAEGIWQTGSFSIISSREDIVIRPNVPTSGGRRVINNGHKLADDMKSDTLNISEVSPMHLWFLEIQTLTESSQNNGTNNELGDGSNNILDNIGLPGSLEDEITELQDIPEIPDMPEEGIVLSLGIIPERMKHFFQDENTYNLDIIEFNFDHWFEIPNDPHYENNFTGPWTYELLVDDHLANKYNLVRGSEVNLSINSEPETFSVTGIFTTNLLGGFFEDYVDGIVILHLSELQSLLGDDVVIIDNNITVLDSVETLAISLNPDRPKGNSPGDIAFGIQEKYPLLDVLTKEDQLEQLEEQNAITNVFYTAISMVAIIIGLLFVACIMLISVYERINEIGMLRAIGIARMTIFKWVISESLLLIVLGVLIGFLPGYFGSKLLGEYLSSSIGISQELTAFSPGLVLSSFIGMVILGTLVSLIPAVRASTMRVASALSFVR